LATVLQFFPGLAWRVSHGDAMGCHDSELHPDRSKKMPKFWDVLNAVEAMGLGIWQE